MVSIFISHAHSDWRLAKRLQELLEETSGKGFQVDRSSEEGAIKSGEDWRGWIDSKVLGCDVAIVLLTPGSFRAHWVLWEAGAVTGVQYERLKGAHVSAADPLARRVRVLSFALDDVDMGPFGANQARNGLTAEGMIAFVSELLNEFRPKLEERAFTKGLLALNELAKEFVGGAKEDLRYTPIHASESVVQEWLARLDSAQRADDYGWMVASKRWINVAFLGANSADAHTKGEAVDFRIHMRIAHAHRHLGDWAGAIEQLKLSESMSPNDLVVLRELGRAYRATKDTTRLKTLMDRMQQLDQEIFREDREGVALRCGHFADLEDWNAVDDLLANANQRLIRTDAYLSNWRAIASMKVHGPEKSKDLFRQVKSLLEQTGKGFWDDANIVNALLALNEQEEARARLASLGLPNRPPDDVRSASRFYDDIISSFGHKFDWKAAAGIS